METPGGSTFSKNISEANVTIYRPSEEISDLPVPFRVLALVDDPHAATAQFFEDLVVR